MVLATWWGWGDLTSIALAVVLAFFFGYLLTYISVRRHGRLAPRRRRLALAADTVSITSMEIIDNPIMLVIPGAMARRPGLGPVLAAASPSRWPLPSSSRCR